MRTKLKILFLLATFLFPIVVHAQELNGEMQASPPVESSKINPEPDKSLLIVHSEIPNLRFDSNRKIDKVEETAIGTTWNIWLPSGTHILKISSKGYELLELPAYNFQKHRAYEIRVKEVRVPRGAFTGGGKGSLFVSTDPEGANLTVDGMLGTWTTPTTLKKILATDWNLVITKPRYDTLFVSATVVHDSVVRLEHLQLVSQFGYIQVNTIYPCSMILDGTPQKYKNDTALEVPHGDHHILLKRNKFSDYDKTVTILPGQTVAIQPVFIPNVGYISFENMSEAEVYIDGKQARLTDYHERSIGTHQIAIAHPVFGNRTRECIISPGEVRKLTLADFFELGTLDISTDALADIYLDGKSLGNNSVHAEAVAGEHNILLRHTILGDLQESIVLQPLKEKKIFLSMLPSRSTSILLCVIPGASQIYTCQKTRGYLYLSAFIASVGSSSYFLIDYQNQKTEYEDIIRKYNNAQTALDAARYRNQIRSKYISLEDTRNYRNVAFLSIAAVYAVSILDRLIFSPEYGYRQRETSISMNMQAGPTRDGIQLTWRIPQ